MRQALPESGHGEQRYRLLGAKGETGDKPRFLASEREKQRRCEYDHDADDKTLSHADYKEIAECMGVQSNN